MKILHQEETLLPNPSQLSMKTYPVSSVVEKLRQEDVGGQSSYQARTSFNKTKQDPFQVYYFETEHAANFLIDFYMYL